LTKSFAVHMPLLRRRC